MPWPERGTPSRTASSGPEYLKEVECHAEQHDNVDDRASTEPANLVASEQGLTSRHRVRGADLPLAYPALAWSGAFVAACRTVGESVAAVLSHAPVDLSWLQKWAAKAF